LSSGSFWVRCSGKLVINDNKQTQTVSHAYVHRYFTAYSYRSDVWLVLTVGKGQEDVRIRFGLLFFIVNNSVMAILSIVQMFFEQRTTFYHEIQNSYYHSGLYYLSMLIVQIPVSIIENFLFLVIVYPMTGLYGGVNSNEFVFLWLILVLLNMTGRSFVMLLVSVSKTMAVALVLQPIMLIMFFLIAGFFAPVSSIPPGWRWYQCFHTFTLIETLNTHVHLIFLSSTIAG
jgi:ABC-type multidrug transport system permease subunit